MKCQSYKKFFSFVKIISIAFFIALPSFSFAKVYISEIMYDLPGTDTDREWLEIHNDGDTTIDLKNWKIDDGADAKHGLNEPPKNGGKGDLKIGPNEYIILADKADVFLSEHIGYSKKVIDTVLDFTNKGETISLIDDGGAVADSLSYNDSMGGKGDENSLHRKNNILEAGRDCIFD
jgi:hypothetical protein